MVVEQILGFDLVGLRTRTKNEDEANPATAQIAPLWARFSAEAVPNFRGTPQVYGVYTNYETDYSGMFDVYACSDLLSTDMSEDFQSVHIREGKYLVFSAEGEMPQAVIDLWGEVWNYFSAPECPHERAYTTDFEHYMGPNKITVSISIK
ncbi:GyrI-like domain-containing protein [Microbulbifer echini]|uniref:GyrI-like domain-containing protein n=1 Tax=Microbulbifer echini TaxID=1529067 RepID=A0ABV4NN83_9GAMM|nr:effector binding domain-containing protein [uncultured Microbulbifer sp.]